MLTRMSFLIWFLICSFSPLTLQNARDKGDVCKRKFSEEHLYLFCEFILQLFLSHIYRRWATQNFWELQLLFLQKAKVESVFCCSSDVQGMF